MTPDQSVKLAQMGAVARALHAGSSNSFHLNARGAYPRSKAAASIYARYEIAETRADEYAVSVGFRREDEIVNLRAPGAIIVIDLDDLQGGSSKL